MRIPLIIAASFYSIGFCQEVRLSVQTGHSSTVNRISYNHDESLVGTCSSDHNVAVWHIESGKQYANLNGHSSVVTDLVFHPTKNELYSAGLDSSVIVWDVSEGKMIDRIKFQFPIGSIDVNSKGDQLVVAGEALVLLDIASKTQSKYGLLAKSLFSAVRYSDDDRWIAIGGKEEKLGYVVEVAKEQIVSKFFASINDIDFHESGQSFYYASENGGITHYNFFENKIEGATNKSEWNSFNAVRVTSQYIVGATDEAEIVLFNRKNWLKEKVLKAHLQGIRCLEVDKSGKHLLSAGLDKRLILWDLHRLEMVRMFQSSIYKINHIAFNESGEDIFIGFSNGFVRKTNLFTNSSVANRSRLNQAQIENGWEFLLTDIASFDDRRAKFEMVLLRNSKGVDGAYNYLKNIDLNWDFQENEIVLDELNSKSDKIKTYEKSLKLGKVLPQTYLMTAANLSSSGKKFTAAVTGTTLLVTDKAGKKIIERELDHTDRVTSVALNEAQNFVATASWDGMIKFWSLDDGDLLTTFGAFGAHDFVYLSPDNYYFASKGALDNIGFLIEGQIFAFDQFDLKYNRPDLVFEKLPYMDDETVANYNKAYKKRLSKLGLKESDLTISSNMPSIEITNATGATSYDGAFNYSVKAGDDEFQLDKYHVLVNGVPIFSRKGQTVTGSSFEATEKIKLNPGKNVLQFYVTNEHGVSSFKKSLQVTSKEKNVTSDLYLMTLGCSKYQQGDFNLNFAEKDASDIVAHFEKDKSFDNVHVKKLVDNQVTKAGVEELKAFIKPAKESDIVLLFVAGHGVLDANLDYFIAAHDMDFKKPEEKGIPIAFFEDLLDETASRRKLMFIDACHSGEIDKSEVEIDNSEVENIDDMTFRAVGASVKNVNEVNSFELSKIAFADMRESNGATVVSSAGGGEFAMEGQEWSNGVFTYALLNGLKSGDADLNKDKRIMISELQTYLVYTVNKMTGGRQTPTSRVENLINDFRIQ